MTSPVVASTTFRIARHVGVVMRAIAWVPFVLVLLATAKDPPGWWDGMLIVTLYVTGMEWFLRSVSLTLTDSRIEYTELLRRKQISLDDIAEAQVLGLFDTPTAGNGPMELLLIPRAESESGVVVVKARMFPRTAIETVIEAIHRHGGEVPVAWLSHTST